MANEPVTLQAELAELKLKYQAAVATLAAILAVELKEQGYGQSLKYMTGGDE